MRPLSASQLEDRLRLDWEVIQRLQSPWLSAKAFRNENDMANNKHLLPGEDGARARLYLVGYRFNIPTSPTTLVNGAVVRFDLLAGGNYPLSCPHVYIESRPMPWGPHVYPNTGVFCLGLGWLDSGGHMLLAQLIVHVARLLNMDHPHGDAFDAANGPALHHWKRSWGQRPFNPDLRYPQLPKEITHGIRDRGAFVFSPKMPSRQAANPNLVFRPRK